MKRGIKRRAERGIQRRVERGIERSAERGIERRVDRGRWRGGVGSEEGGEKRELERRRG